MGGAEKAKANQMADQQFQTQQSDKNAFQGNLDTERTSAQSHADDLYKTQAEGYKSLLDPSGTLTSIFPNGYGAGRSVATPQLAQYTRDPKFDEALTNYRDFASGGGIDDKRKGSIDETIGNLKEFGRTGGLDQTAMDRMRGNGYYEEFAKTGGMSDADRTNYRARATSVIPAMYSRLKDEANRTGNVQGGYGPGKDVMMSRLARDNASALSGATRGAEADIADRVAQGRQFGISGISNSESDLQHLRTGNMLAGMSGAGALDMNLADAIQKGRMFGSSGVEGIAQSDQALSGRNTDIANQQAQINASAANAGSGNASADAKWAAEFGLNQKLAGLSGISSLYGALPAELANNDQMNLQNRGLAGNLSNTTVGQKLSSNKSGWDQFSNIAGSVGGAIAGGATGLSSIGGLTKRKPMTVMPAGGG